MNIKVIEFGTEEYEESLKIRNEVLRIPWGRSIKEDDLSLERTNDILIGYFLNNKLCGLIVLHPISKLKIQIKYLCVYKEYSGKGIGRQLVQFSENYVKEKGFCKIILESRDTALNFYRNMNYEVIGKAFMPEFVPIKHIPMEKNI